MKFDTKLQDREMAENISEVAVFGNSVYSEAPEYALWPNSNGRFAVLNFHLKFGTDVPTNQGQ